ncbi:MAG: PilN domain-containing protein [Planctomycetota bacterium]
MSKRTILLITEATLGRFDLSGGASPSVTESWVRPSFASQSAGTLADAALRLGKSRGRQVYVLTTRCWIGSVSIGPELVSGSTGDDLDQMIALEAETYSGISAFESASANVPLPNDALGDHRFWLTQIADSDVRSIDDAIRQAGGKMLGIAHPAVPRVIPSASPTEPWCSLQNWDESTLLIRGNGDAIADFHSMSSGLQSQRTVQEFETFFQAAAPDSSLQWIGPGELTPSIADLPPAQGHQTISTTSESDLSRWAAAWMASQAKPGAGGPLITIPKKPMSREAGIGIAAVLGLLMMGLCFAHYRYMKQQYADIDGNVQQMRGQQDRLKNDKDRFTELQKEKDAAEEQVQTLVAQIRKTRLDVATAKQVVKRGKRRWLSLVDSLVDVSDDDGWVREIESTDETVSIRGLATNDAAVHRLAARLESTSAAELWQILPASTSNDPDTGLIEFQIELVALGSQTSM